MDFNERLIPGVSANYLYQEALSRYEFALEIIQEGSMVLDLGCGTGYGSELLSARSRVIGVDSSTKAIRFAKSNYKGPAFMVADAHLLPFSKNKFDFVVSYELIEHLKKPKTFLTQVRRVLKTGGTLILSTPNRDYKKTMASPYHEREYTANELAKLLKGKFKKVELFGQTKSKDASVAHKKFLESQDARQGMVDLDKVGFRYLFPRRVKEYIWIYIGAFFGRYSQEMLQVSDFPIKKDSMKKAEYFVCVCK